MWIFETLNRRSEKEINLSFQTRPSTLALTIPFWHDPWLVRIKVKLLSLKVARFFENQSKHYQYPAKSGLFMQMNMCAMQITKSRFKQSHSCSVQIPFITPSIALKIMLLKSTNASQISLLNLKSQIFDPTFPACNPSWCFYHYHLIFCPLPLDLLSVLSRCFICFI